MSNVARLEIQSDKSDFKCDSLDIKSDKPFSIGRTEGVDLFVSNPKISRNHIQINYDNTSQSLMLTKITSNLVKINGEPIEKDKPIVIHIGDKIEMSTYEVVVKEPAGGPVDNKSAKQIKEKTQGDKPKGAGTQKQNSFPSPKVIYDVKSAEEPKKTVETPADHAEEAPKQVSVADHKVVQKEGNNSKTSEKQSQKRVEQAKPETDPAKPREQQSERKAHKGTDVAKPQKTASPVAPKHQQVTTKPSVSKPTTESVKVKEVPQKRAPTNNAGQTKSASQSKTLESPRQSAVTSSPKEVRAKRMDSKDSTNLSELIAPEALAESISALDREELEASAVKKLNSSKSTKRKSKKLQKMARKRLVSSKLAQTKGEDLKDILVVAAKESNNIASRGIHMSGTAENFDVKPIIDGAVDGTSKFPIVDATFDLAYKLGSYAARSDRTRDSCVVKERLEEFELTSKVLNDLLLRLSNNTRIVDTAINDISTEMTVLEHDYKEAYNHISDPIYLPTRVVKHFELNNEKINFPKRDIEAEVKRQNLSYKPN